MWQSRVESNIIPLHIPIALSRSKHCNACSYVLCKHVKYSFSWVCGYSHSRNKAVANCLEVMWPKSRGVLSPDPTLLPGGTHRLDTRLVVSAHSSKGVWGHAPPGKLNTGKLLLKTSLSMSSAILGKQTFDTWYTSTLWGSYRRCS